MQFVSPGSVSVEPVPVRGEVLDELQSHLLVMYSGVERPAKLVLSEQGQRVRDADPATLEGMHRIKALGRDVYDLLRRGDVDQYGELLHEHWQHKRRLASKMTDATLDEHYTEARRAGAIGGKLIGAGGGGFFMFYVRPGQRRRVLEALSARGLRPLRFRFDLDGARILLNLHRAR